MCRSIEILRNVIKITAGAAAALLPSGGNICIYCQNRFAVFLPFGRGSAGVPPLMIALRMVGSDVDRHLCSICDCNDRERHLRLYFEATGQIQALAGSRVLHFAPEKRFAPWLASLAPSEHILADLYPATSAVRKIDLLALPFAADYFDFVIVNHVLEHVDDDTRALSEIYRVLKPGGIAILQTPYCEGICEKIEDHAVIAPEARLQLYGQEDHVRLYGRDFRSYICSQGFEDLCVAHGEILSDVDTKRYGVNALEPFLRFRKPIR